MLPAVEAITKEVEGMNRIISDFLSFAKPSDLVISKINLKELIQESIQALDAADKVSIMFKGADAVKISGDEVLLRQCMTNLLQNSLESMRDGGGLTIEVSTADLLKITEFSYL